MVSASLAWDVNPRNSKAYVGVRIQRQKKSSLSVIVSHNAFGVNKLLIVYLSGVLMDFLLR